MHLHETMFPYIALAEDKPWQPGPYEGVELKILHKNEDTGGVVVLRKFHADKTIPAHTHPAANEWAWILSGEWEESAVTYTPGTLFYLDPPYFGTEDYYGPGVFSAADFEVLSTLLEGIQGRFILSLNDTPEVRAIFGRFGTVGLAR